MKVFKFRIYPSKQQRTVLKRYLEICRKTYNKCLEYKIQKYKEDKTSVSEFDLNKKICDWRNLSEFWMQECGIAILHDVSRRVDKAFKSFFRRVKQKDGKVGFPRFKGVDRYDSFTTPRFVCKFKENKIRLTNDLGWVKIKQHRKMDGEIKGYTIARNACGDWFIYITSNIPKPHFKPIDKSNNIGIDFGCKDVLTLSDGGKFENLKFLKKKEKELAKVKKKENKHAAAKIHKKISNKRNDYCHKIANEIVKKYDVIFTENINIQKLANKTFKTVGKSMRDGAWGKLSLLLSYKAEDAGKIYGKVNPAYTSKKCSNCGKIHENQTLADRVMECSCGYSANRDVNAARNILALGLQGLEQS
ncbi:MAG: transposase [Sulfurimonas sp.]